MGIGDICTIEKRKFGNDSSCGVSSFVVALGRGNLEGQTRHKVGLQDDSAPDYPTKARNVPMGINKQNIIRNLNNFLLKIQ